MPAHPFYWCATNELSLWSVSYTIYYVSFTPDLDGLIMTGSIYKPTTFSSSSSSSVMKFTQYLHDTQTPEWKKAYIDYCGLKKCIGAIRAEQISGQNSAGTDADHVRKHEVHSGHSAPTDQLRATTPGAVTTNRRCSWKVASLIITWPGCPSSHPPVQEIPPALHTLIPLLPPLHANFFELLDAELEKIDSFYAKREKEMRDRSELLKQQLNELALHRQKYYESNTNDVDEKFHLRLLTAFIALKPRSHRHADADKYNQQAKLLIFEPGHEENEAESSRERKSQSPASLKCKHAFHVTKATGNVPRSSWSTAPKQALDPQEYQYAKKCLKKALIENYRGLEALNNYRVLNLTGFRKALKKYEKVTKAPVQAAYMTERVEPSAIASGATVSSMLKETEELFAATFERGDKKRAIARLRVGAPHKSHHFSTFRTGLWLGSSISATVAGLIICLRDSTRVSLPAWDLLLFIYSIFLLPALFALLIGLNLVVWASTKINYVFIFELDVRTRLDHREFFELPAFLLCALAHCFLLSFVQVGPPLIWPLVWLALMIIVIFNPIPNFLWGRSRWWLIKHVAKLGTSGFQSVEFTDFWLSDQFCSLAYSLSNLYFVGCFYSNYFPNIRSAAVAASSLASTVFSSAYDPAIQQAWSTCGAERNWAPCFVLASLPFMVRFMQSLRRYWDSKLPTHLINAGKYGMGMVCGYCFSLWRRDGTRGTLILWCFSATVYALYGCAWDFLMDWSVCKPCAKYPLLRRELLYSSHIPMYYVALVTNFAIRFIWILYIPFGERWFTATTFMIGLMEMIRRIQWNFYRLENEHLGNMDQYRITREVPLPYSLDKLQSNEDDEEEEGEREDDQDYENHEVERLQE